MPIWSFFQALCAEQLAVAGDTNLWGLEPPEVQILLATAQRTNSVVVPHIILKDPY